MTWTPETASAYLQRLGYKVVAGVIWLDKGDTPGLGAWGALDFLRHHGGISVRRMT